jgi:protein involved in sex pheromone biosynthesis
VDEKYLNLNGKFRRFKAISVYFSAHTKMVGGDYSQNEKAHTYSLG